MSSHVDVSQSGATTFSKERDVFISHSTKDVEVAEELCARLEREGISVWIAPRDVRPGRKYGEEILNAIEGTRATILVLSESSNASVHVHHEVERAISKGKSVFPVRVANVPPARAIELFISSSQWIDLWGAGRAAGFDRLVDALREHLGRPGDERTHQAGVASTPVVHAAPRPIAAPRSRRWALIGALAAAAVVVAGVLWQTGVLSSGPAIALQVDGPSEAEVHVDGKLAGVAQAGKTKQFSVAAGVHQVHVEASGYWPVDKSVEAVAGGEPVAVRLAKKSSLIVTIETPGATVLINGKRVDRPFPLELPDGRHTVEVTAVGYETFRKTVTLGGGAQEQLEVALNKTRSRDNARPQIASPPPAPSSPAPGQSESTGADAFLRGLGEGFGRGGAAGRPPIPSFPMPRR
jgi:limonene-1,2-epoxide hydrolase